MSDPIVFISHSRVKEGKLAALREMTRTTMPDIEAEKPGTVMQHGYLDESGTEIHFIHVFPDAQAMDAHMVGAAERSRKAFELIETRGFDIYGEPSDEALATLRQAPGVDVVVNPLSVGGFIRLGATATES